MEQQLSKDLSNSDSARIIISAVVERYLGSGDYNGLPLSWLPDLGVELLKARTVSKQLVREGRLRVSAEGNPHILGFEPQDEQTQLNAISNANPDQTCLYPTRDILLRHLNSDEYADRPFTRMLAEGTPQLKHLFFDLRILEFYRSDPRFTFWVNDVSGSIGIKDEFYESDATLARDKTFIRAFGFAFDHSFRRTVGACVRYLSDLSPEHQLKWQSETVKGKYKLHPGYWTTHICGQFDDHVPVFDAILKEMEIINEMCWAIGRPHLFKRTFNTKNKPRQLCFLIRPTLREYNEFIHTLDKITSENIDRRFFLNDIKFVKTKTKRGKTTTTTLGSLGALDEWLKTVFKTDDRKSISEMIKCFKSIRSMRTDPAHKLDDNIFDQEFIKKQQKVAQETYLSFRTLRLILACHPSTSSVPVPTELKNGKIWWK